MKKIALVCAAGIGDALIVQMAAFRLKENGFQTTTFSNHLGRFGKWLEGFSVALQPDLEKIEEILADYDAIFLQHDNSPKARKIHSLSKPVYTFYGSHQLSKHGPLKFGYDFVCDPEKTMVENMAEAVEKLFRLPSDASRENGLKPPQGLKHRKYLNRIAIHPISAEEKNWPKEKFLKAADLLSREGYKPVFLVPPEQRFIWGGPEMTTLEDLASFLYESGYFIGVDSGPGHLASYLQIPHLIIANDARQMRFWRPGWLRGEVLVPPKWIPRWKILRPHWKMFISIKSTIKRLKDNVLKIK